MELPTRKRFNILALVFVSVIINYMDRTNISVAAAALSDEFSLSTVQMGLVFSVFGWSYALLQIPGGLAVDRIKVRLLYPFMLAAWSLATLVTGFIHSFAALLGCRIAVGVFEAPSYPCNNKIATAWFPENERASAIGTYTSGQFIGLAFLMPVLAIIQEYFGWRGLFVITGLVGIVWAVIWYSIYRDPEDHPSVNQAELDLIKGGREHSAVDEDDTPVTKQDVIEVFTNRKLWGIYIGKFCLGSTFIFFLTWFPTYLVEYRGLSYVKSGILASLPFLAAFVGVVVSGVTSDFLVRRKFSVEFSRKAPVVVGMLLMMSIVGANYTDDTFWVIFFLSVAFFGNGLSSIAWVFVSFLAPPRLIGLVGGAFNFISGLSAVIIPLAIGFLVTEDSFAPALVLISAIAGIGAFAFLFLVGKIRRIDIEDESEEVAHA